LTRWLLVLAGTVLAVVLGAPVSAAPQSGRTVISFTFDGTFKSQGQFASILSRRDMAGTFYVNSAYLDYPAYLTVDQLRSIARHRHEIGSASLYGNDLTAMPGEQAKREVCDDRATLAQLGFQVTSFAYPRGAQNASVKAVVQRCGFNSGRRYTGLYGDPTSCSSCPAGETLPPTDDFRIRTTPQVTTLKALQAQVTRVEEAGGGWLPLVFTKVCVCPGEHEAISPRDFDLFVAWVERRPNTKVKTVDQVMGGVLKPVHGAALERLVPDPSSAISRQEPLSRQAAWTVLGLGMGQAQIIFTGVAVSIAMVVTYRLATRGNRHGV
jgi:peptidoglycan/xylan/chitin deacetylase (PgdA/CDA1 family)